MDKVPFVTVSIVLYKNNFEEISKIIFCFQKTEVKKIIIVDNSPSDDLRNIINIDSRIDYTHMPSNPGFGSAHNIAIKKSMEHGATYHFVCNPDIYFNGDVIGKMVDYMRKNKDVGMLMPQILNHDGSIQYLPKLLPSLFSIFIRKFKKPQFYYKKIINQYELRFVNEDVIYKAPVLSGCFTLLNLKAIREIGMYDDSYFMYFEDWDLSRRMYEKYKTIYFPKVSVYHGYESGANKSIILFKIYVNSAIAYFNKWGWFFDSKRKMINEEILSQFE